MLNHSQERKREEEQRKRSERFRLKDGKGSENGRYLDNRRNAHDSHRHTQRTYQPTPFPTAAKENPRTIEKVNTVRHNPKWELDAQIEIAASKEEAVQADEAADEEVRIYSDGSAIDRGVGAAAVLTREGRKLKILHFHLGPALQHTVYKAEIVEMILAVELLR
ncbi:uncharacterized protein HD556DRAFT_1302865 [Suillus plorans]|uniref:RNase H type-1 domain-containing protein n=1 Tax=Suillus plorans TaxID=116603 RepID=A0A9P7J6Y9_9AGAM|nr:uncharacterized protein HD556DRAFT_1302865 [Suillus plorans]KAG1806373.1 hypothetical protein HD556DRAFT_1302865 [Suillus plorans]